MKLAGSINTPYAIKELYMIGFDDKYYQIGDTVELHGDVRSRDDSLGRRPARGVVRHGRAGRSSAPRWRLAFGLSMATGPGKHEVLVELDAMPGRLFSGSPRMFQGTQQMAFVGRVEPAPEWDQVERLTWTPGHQFPLNWTPDHIAIYYHELYP